MKCQFTRTRVSPRDSAYPELALLLLLPPVVLQIHPRRVWLAGKVMGCSLWVCGASPGPQHLGSTSTCSEESTSWHTKPCQSSSCRSLLVTWTNNYASSDFGGGLIKSEWGQHRSSASVYYTQEEKSVLTNGLKAWQGAVEDSPSSCFTVRK